MNSDDRKAAIVQGADFLASVWRKLVRAVENRGGKQSNLHVLDTAYGALLLDRFACSILNLAASGADYVFEAMVDYGINLAGRIVRADCPANPEMVHAYLPKFGATSGQKKLVFEFLSPRPGVRDDVLVSQMALSGRRPATLEEFLAFQELGRETSQLAKFFSRLITLDYVASRERAATFVPYFSDDTFVRKLDWMTTDVIGSASDSELGDYRTVWVVKG